MGRNKDRSWERLSQVDKVMRDNKPVKVHEYTKSCFWEPCVKEYLDKQKRLWDQKRK